MRADSRSDVLPRAPVLLPLHPKTDLIAPPAAAVGLSPYLLTAAAAYFGMAPARLRAELATGRT